MKKKLAFICARGLDSFIEPLIQKFEGLDKYRILRYYVATNQEIKSAVAWADIIWIEWANEVAMIVSRMYEAKKKKIIIRLHSYEALSDMPKQVDWSVVDYLVFVAPHIRAIVKEQIPDLEKKVCTKIVYNGIDLDSIKSVELVKGDEFNIAYVANINHKKEPALAIQIMSRLVNRDKQWKLHVAGAFQDKRFEIYLKYIIKELGIEDNVLFYGFVKDMNTFYEHKRFILSTSIHEGHPYNIMEGAAHGLQPIIHNFYGAKELYPAGWVFNSIEEAERLFYYDVKVLGNGTVLALRSENNDTRDYIIKRGWTRENQMEQLIKLIDRLGGKK